MRLLARLGHLLVLLGWLYTAKVLLLTLALCSGLIFSCRASPPPPSPPTPEPSDIERGLAAVEALAWPIRTLAKAMFPFLVDEGS